MGVLAVVDIMIVVAHNLPPPSPEEQARRAFADVVRNRPQRLRSNESRIAVAQCVAYVGQVAPNYNNSFDAYYDPTTRYHWTTFMIDYGSADFQWRKCMSGLGYSMD
jgi:hypothetical protein